MLTLSTRSGLGLVEWSGRGASPPTAAAFQTSPPAALGRATTSHTRRVGPGYNFSSRPHWGGLRLPWFDHATRSRRGRGLPRILWLIHVTRSNVAGAEVDAFDRVWPGLGGMVRQECQSSEPSGFPNIAPGRVGPGYNFSYPPRWAGLQLLIAAVLGRARCHGPAGGKRWLRSGGAGQ